MAKQRAKEMRRRERAVEKLEEARSYQGKDRDLEGITPGPQEPVWKRAGVLTEEEVEAIEIEEAAAEEEEAERASR